MQAVIRPLPVEQTRDLRRIVLRPHQTLEELAGHEPEDAFAVGAFRGDELVAVGLIGRDGPAGSWRVRGMATAPGARRQGLGAAVLEALLQHARERGAVRVWGSVRTPARSFYERAGFQATSDEFELPDIGPHVVMDCALADT
jgi:GNAT superfamily N-acetyltransferase